MHMFEDMVQKKKCRNTDFEKALAFTSSWPISYWPISYKSTGPGQLATWPFSYLAFEHPYPGGGESEKCYRYFSSEAERAPRREAPRGERSETSRFFFSHHYLLQSNHCCKQNVVHMGRYQVTFVLQKLHSV